VGNGRQGDAPSVHWVQRHVNELHEGKWRLPAATPLDQLDCFSRGDNNQIGLDELNRWVLLTMISAECCYYAYTANSIIPNT
jgi:hypothetical protein